MKTLYLRLSIILGIILMVTMLISIFGIKLFLAGCIMVVAIGSLFASVVYIAFLLYLWITEDL